MNITRIALRNIFRNKRRTILSLSAIAIATMVIVLMFSFIEGLKLDQRTTVLKFTTGEARIRNKSYEQYQFSYPYEFTVNDYGRVLGALSGIKDIAATTARIRFAGELAVRWETLNAGTDKELKLFNETVPIIGFGIDFSTQEDFFSLASYILPGGRIPAEGEALVGDEFAQKFNVKQGDAIFLFSENDSRKLIVSGLIAPPIEQFRQKTVFTSLASAQDILALTDKVIEILIHFRDPVALNADVEEVKSTLAGAGFSDLEVKSWTEATTVSYIELAQAAYDFIALFFFIIGTTVIVNTTMMVIYERMREIGTLRALGMTGKQMIYLFFMEAFFISLGAALVGVILGACIVIPLGISGFDFGKLTDLGKTNFSISNIIYPQLNLRSTLFVFVYSVLVASLVSFIPSRKAAKVEPIEALRAV
jgi:putative ABC transport system permease protein